MRVVATTSYALLERLAADLLDAVFDDRSRRARRGDRLQTGHSRRRDAIGDAAASESALQCTVSRHRAYVGIGTNLGDRARNVERALAALSDFGNVVRRSSLYRTQPWGKLDQPWFVNAVVLARNRPAAARAARRASCHRSIGSGACAAIVGGRARSISICCSTTRLDIDETGVQRAAPASARARLRASPARRDRRSLRDAPRCAAGVGPRGGRASRGAKAISRCLQERISSVSERVRTLARFLADAGAVRVRVTRGDEDIEIAMRSRHATQEPEAPGRPASNVSSRPDRYDQSRARRNFSSQPARAGRGRLGRRRSRAGLHRSARHSHAGS